MFYIPEECDKFYDGCLQMSGKYGNDLDTAMVNIAVGSMWTNAKVHMERDTVLNALHTYIGDRLEETRNKKTGNRMNNKGRATVYQRLL